MMSSGGVINLVVVYLEWSYYQMKVIDLMEENHQNFDE